MKKLKVSDWMIRCEELIGKHSTKARTRGKYKGHGSTDSVAWVQELTAEVRAMIRRERPGQAYDENLALASTVGLILVAWYTNIHRAKTYDENRPLSHRRRAYRNLHNYCTLISGVMHNDRLIGKVWSHQTLRPPFGANAKGGKFV